MKKALQIIFVTLASIHLLGGPYSLVQVIAWSTMFVQYQQEKDFFEAAKDTFSGERPCQLCKKISEAERTDLPASTPFSDKTKLSLKAQPDHFQAASLDLPRIHWRNHSMVGFEQPCIQRGIEDCPPPLPPPRHFA